MRVFALAALALTMACAAPQQKTQAPVKELSYEELSKLLEQKDKVFFLDVREPAEIAQLGSVNGYVNIPLGQLESRLREVPRDKVIVTL